MIYFVLPTTRALYEQCKNKYQMHSSDISDIEGFLVEDYELDKFQIKGFNIYNIPERYQDNIDEFITDYWDGDFSFEENLY